ncbi:MAG: GreA/GreB family elongation factor [Candidatus Velthaea sp.]
MSRAFVRDDDAIHEPVLPRRKEVSARLLVPPSDRGMAGFGATVVVDGGSKPHQSFTIVTDDEADALHGKIGLTSPLAQALAGARVGQRVVWHRPIGDLTLEITAIDYAPDPKPL